MNLREAAQQALEALKMIDNAMPFPVAKHAIKQLSDALAEPEQGPVASAWMHNGVMINAFPWPPSDPRARDENKYWENLGYYSAPLYTHPPQRKPLTDEEICHVVRYEAVGTSNLDIARAIERAHGIGGEA
jgi:hypothetical protein